MTVRSNLSKFLTRELKKMEMEEKELAETIVFGKYIQKSDGIYVKKDDALIKIGNVKMESVKLYDDELEISDVKIDWIYRDLTFDKTVCLNMKSKDEIEAHLKSNITFKSSKTIMPFIESVLHSDWEGIEKERGIFIEGFFYHNGKVVNNTANKADEYTSDDVRDAINLINTILSNRGTAKPNDATVMRFMLWSPFAYCLKQIGFSDAIYSLMLYGKAQTSKTGSVANFSWFYSEPDDTDKVISTLSVFGSRLQESTLPTLVDESKSFLADKDNHDPIKRAILSKKTRGVKSTNNNKEIDEYDALSLPIFTYNEYLPISDYFGRRFKLCYYDPSMIISDEEKKTFSIKYLPKSPKSKFRIFRSVGKAFQDKMIPYIEKSDERLMDIEKLTVDICKEIASDVGVEFDECIYEIQESNTDTFIDLKSEIKYKLNQLFRKNHYKGTFKDYSTEDFIACANNGEIPFLFINSKREFVIHSSNFVKTVSELVDESLNLKEIMNYLELGEPETKTLTVNGQSMKGFKIDAIDLEWKVFGIRATGRNNDEYDDCGWWCE